jgi:hypothetical protein
VVFGIKAAVFPLFSWLPDSYPTASSPVTAVFAGLLTKVGVYSVLRTQTLLFPGTQVIAQVLLVLAVLTMVVGILGALVQDDLKRLLSSRSSATIGYMLFGLGLASTAGSPAPCSTPSTTSSCRRRCSSSPAGRAARGHLVAAPLGRPAAPRSPCWGSCTCSRPCRWPGSRRCRASSPSSAAAGRVWPTAGARRRRRRRGGAHQPADAARDGRVWSEVFWGPWPRSCPTPTRRRVDVGVDRTPR